jgi:hypothetical protein
VRIGVVVDTVTVSGIVFSFPLPHAGATMATSPTRTTIAARTLEPAPAIGGTAFQSSGANRHAGSNVGSYVGDSGSADWVPMSD